jgi:hypothetical protein
LFFTDYFSIWMYQASNAITFSNAQPGPNPQLRLLFYRTAALLALPTRAVFVFDGPHRPEFKRGTRVLTHGHWLTSAFRELIREFGYHSHTASKSYFYIWDLRTDSNVCRPLLKRMLNLGALHPRAL